MRTNETRLARVESCSRRLQPFHTPRECGKPAVAVLRLEGTSAQVVFCAEHRDEYLASGQGWYVHHTVPGALHENDVRELSLGSILPRDGGR